MRPALPGILALLILAPIAFADPAPARRPRLDVEALFAQRVAEFCKDANPDPANLKEDERLQGIDLKDATANYEAAFRAELSNQRFSVGRGGWCSSVQRDLLPLVYGRMAGAAAVEEAQKKAFAAICKSLRERKDKPYITNGASLLHVAVRENDAEGLRLLLKSGIAPDLRGEVGVTALSEAIRQYRLPLVKVLLEHRASVYQATSIYEDSPLDAAIRAPGDRAYELVELLLAHGADANGLCTIGIADPRLLAMLIKSGADVRTANGDGYTALHFAASEEIARLLLDAGADINAVANDELTPLDNVEELNVIRFLRTKGAVSSQKSLVRFYAYTKLDEPVPVNFDKNKLIDILSYYRNCTGLSMCIDWRALEAAGIKKDTLITLSLRETSAQDSLRLVLGQVSTKMVFEVDSAGTVIIGTLESVQRIANHIGAAGEFVDPDASPKRLAAMKLMTQSLDTFDIEHDLEDGSLNIEEALDYIASRSGKPPRIDWTALKKASLDPKHKVELLVERRTSLCHVLNYLLAHSGATSWAIGISEAGEVVISTEKEFDAYMKAGSAK